jgi:hypothetical protein
VLSRRHRPVVITAVRVDELHAPDRPPGPVELTEDLHQVLRVIDMDHHLAAVCLTVEPDVGKSEVA